MNTWPVQDAKARFSEMLDTCLSSGAQMVTRRGQNAAVLVPLEEWQRLSQNAKPSLGDLLRSDEGRFDMALPDRGNWVWRDIDVG
jgi:prevent-host-death family protein